MTSGGIEDGRSLSRIAEKGQMVAAAEMTVPRAAHTATLLKGGKVLITGGCTISGCEMSSEGATAELYDPLARSFVRTGSMSTERVSHTATLLSDGRVLVAGGWDEEGVLRTAEVYDPATGTFSRVGDMATARAAHTASPLRDGRVLFVGGYDGERSVPEAEIYDPATDRFEPADDMEIARSAHAATPLADGRVLVTGGSDAREDVVASAEIYDPNLGRFVRAGDMTVSRYKHASTALDDGGVLLVGGSDEDDFYGKRASAEVYDPKSNTFAVVSAMHVKRFKLPDAVATLAGGKVLVGGDGRHAELYEPDAEGFRSIRGSMGSARAFATTVSLANGRALVVGGYDRDIGPSSKAWLYVNW